MTALGQSVEFLNKHPEESAGILSAAYDMPAEQILEYITEHDMQYTTEIFGLERFISFMNDNGYLSGGIKTGDVLFDE